MIMLTIEEALKENGKCVFPIKGESMLPMLEHDKDTVLIVPIDSKLKKYDLPLYKTKNGYLLHRIISVKKDHYVICGDNCIKKETVPFEKVVGVAEGFYKNGKYIPCDDEEYLKYVKSRCRGRWRRALTRYVIYGAKRIFGK